MWAEFVPELKLKIDLFLTIACALRSWRTIEILIWRNLSCRTLTCLFFHCVFIVLQITFSSDYSNALIFWFSTFITIVLTFLFACQNFEFIVITSVDQIIFAAIFITGDQICLYFRREKIEDRKSAIDKLCMFLKYGIEYILWYFHHC